MFRSKEGEIFESLTKVDANGTTSSESNYQFKDVNPYSGISYYQLVQVDFDGRKITYLPVSVKRKQDQHFTIVPNPSDGDFRIKCSVPTQLNTEVYVYNSLGELTKHFELTPKEISIKQLELGLKSGLYYLKL